jgi:uncharacterized protein (DUF2141 family)
MTPIKTSAFLLTALWLAASPRAVTAAETAAPAAAVVLTFKGMKAPSGQIMGALFDSEAAWSGGAPVQALQLKVEGGELVARVTGLRPGRYALRAFHDIDGDGKLSRNPFGTPTEPVAFSNNARAVMGPPSWSEAAFEVGPAGAVQVITVD